MKVALAGSSGSGKSTVAKHLVDRHGFALASTGDICRQISNLLFGGEDKTSLNKVSEMVRQMDPGLFITAALRGLPDDRVVLDSVRYASDISRVQSSGFQVWRVTCPADERIRRLSARGQVIESSDLKHASETELSDNSFNTTIVNGSGEEDDLVAQIDVLLRT